MHVLTMVWFLGEKEKEMRNIPIVYHDSRENYKCFSCIIHQMNAISGEEMNPVWQKVILLW